MNSNYRHEIYILNIHENGSNYPFYLNIIRKFQNIISKLSLITNIPIK